MGFCCERAVSILLSSRPHELACVSWSPHLPLCSQHKEVRSPMCLPCLVCKYMCVCMCMCMCMCMCTYVSTHNGCACVHERVSYHPFHDVVDNAPTDVAGMRLSFCVCMCACAGGGNQVGSGPMILAVRCTQSYVSGTALSFAWQLREMMHDGDFDRLYIAGTSLSHSLHPSLTPSLTRSLAHSLPHSLTQSLVIPLSEKEDRCVCPVCFRRTRRRGHERRAGGVGFLPPAPSYLVGRLASRRCSHPHARHLPLTGHSVRGPDGDVSRGSSWG